MSSVTYEKKLNRTWPLLPMSVCEAVNIVKYNSKAPTTGSENKRKFVREMSAHHNADQTHSVQRRNARERNRVKQVNNSFAKLRQHIPQCIISDLTKGGGRGPHKKVSKVDTLRIAVEYIRRLQGLLDELNGICGKQTSNQLTKNISASSMSSLTKSKCKVVSNVSSQQLSTQQQSKKILKQINFNSLSNIQSRYETSSHSPSSSFNSNISSDCGSFESITQLSPHRIPSSIDAHLQLKFEPYNNFNLNEEDCTPDDEEILDYISLWQQQ